MAKLSLPQEWVKNATVRALREGGTALIEEIAKELNTKQLNDLIRVLSGVRDSRKRTVEVINSKAGE